MSNTWPKGDVDDASHFVLQDCEPFMIKYPGSY